MKQERQKVLDQSNRKNQRLLKIAVVLFLIVLGLLVYQKSQVNDHTNQDDSLVQNISIPINVLGDVLNENADAFYQNLVKSETIRSYHLNPIDLCESDNQKIQSQIYVVNIEKENPETKEKEYKPEYLLSGAVEIVYDNNEVKGYRRWIERSETIEGIHEFVKARQLTCSIP
ncbi:hypothetical protein [Erysipelothrix sp. P66]|uniref:hypothetical protein n=1 Tax=Erysipelothrix sp. P66 TaxID=3141531 RepID=UPI00315DCACF